MASLALRRVSGRRVSSGTIYRKVPVRDFRAAVRLHDAHNFVMPAMSPTMTEGNITSWKVKEGASFSAGDVLLEIETDKAQMDVEAQDDGILAKITQDDGAKGVKVGSRIAVLAEEGDDIQNLEIPAEQPPAGSPASKAQSKTETSSSEESATTKKSEGPSKELESQPRKESSSQPAKGSSKDSRTSTKYEYPLYPSVEHLLRTNNISESQLKEIKATGPGGRLLKGDVLAYLSAVPKGYPTELSERLSKLEHLDLSNIKVATPKAKEQSESETKTAAAPKAHREIEPELEVALPISLGAVFATQRKIKETLGVGLPLSVFIARASEIANDELPRPRGVAPTADELFDAVLGIDSAPRTSRGQYSPIVTSPAPSSVRSRTSIPRELDVIDILTGSVPKQSASAASPVVGAVGAASATSNNIFSVLVPKTEQKRARVYLERIKTVLEVEPGRCVL